MISRIIKKTVDLSKIQKVDQLEGPLYQLENGGHTFEITCLMDGEAAAVSGTVSARFLRADEETVYFTGTLTGNVASITLPQSCYNVNGRFGLVVFVAGNDITSAIYAVAGSVYRSTSDHIIDPTEEIPSLEDLIAKIGECEEATADAQQAASFVPSIIASTYSTSVAYVVGDYCTYEGAMYRCTAETDGAFDPADWEAVKVGSEFQRVDGDVDDLKSAITNVENDVYTFAEMSASTTSSGWRLNESDGLCSSNSDYQLKKYVVVAGNTIRVVSDDRFQFQTIASVPSSGQSNRVGETFGAGSYILEVPLTATYLIVSTPISGSTAAVYGITSNVEKLKFVTGEISEAFNLYDPNATYAVTNKSGTAKTGFTVNSDGTITSTKSNGSDGAIYLVDNSRTLKAGEYNISAKISLSAQISTNNSNVKLCVGRAADSVDCALKTTRDGDTNATGTATEGWVRAAITVSADETFAFEIIVQSSSLASSSYPYTISDIQITKGSELQDYSPAMYQAIDTTCRLAIASETTRVNKELANCLKTKNLIGMQGGVLYPCYIPTNTTLTMSTADGQAIGTAAYLKLYDQDKNEYGSGGWTFGANQSKRTITHTYGAAYYVGWTSTPVKNVQLELGSEATSYVPYVLDVSLPAVIQTVLHSEDALAATDIFNAEPYTGTYDWQTPVETYNGMFNGKSSVEAFAFFTDPHTMGFDDDERNETKMENYFKRVQKVYNSTPCSFMVCGGDWLNNDTTPAEACYRLGLLTGISKHMFDDLHMVVGNHDLNEQGISEAGAARGTGQITSANIAAIMFRDTDTKKAYYSFDGSVAKCYVLDTGLSGSYHSSMTEYDWEQVAWLAGKLAEDDAEHAIIFLHMITNNGSLVVPASTFGTLVQAYNAHTTVTLNNIEYDFSSCTGHVDFWVAGHTHTDSTGTLGGIPYVITGSNGYSSDVPLIELMLVDYAADKVYLTRAGGTGSDRTINL